MKPSPLCPCKSFDDEKHYPHSKWFFLSFFSFKWIVYFIPVPNCFSHVWLCATLWTVACQAPLSMGFCRQEYWNGLPCPPPGDRPDPRIEPMSLMSPALVGGFFTTTSTWEALVSWSAQVNILFHKMVQRHQWINNESKSDFRICMILEMTIINVVWIIHEYTIFYLTIPLLFEIWEVVLVSRNYGSFCFYFVLIFYLF